MKLSKFTANLEYGSAVLFSALTLIFLLFRHKFGAAYGMLLSIPITWSDYADFYLWNDLKMSAAVGALAAILERVGRSRT